MRKRRAVQATAMQAAQTAVTQNAQASQQHELYTHVIESAVALVIAFVVWRLACAAIDRFFARRFLSRHPRATTYVAPVKTLAGFVTLLALVLILLNIWSVNVSPALWSAGVVTAALAFGAQWVVRDLLAGFSIFAETQFDVGDKVQITTGVNSQIFGTVDAIGWRTTRLIDAHGRTVFIPNGNIYATTNLSKGQERVDVTITTPLTISAGTLRGEIEQAVRKSVSDAKLSGADVDVTLDDANAQEATFAISVHAPNVRNALTEGALRERVVVDLQTKGRLPGGPPPSGAGPNISST